MGWPFEKANGNVIGRDADQPGSDGVAEFVDGDEAEESSGADGDPESRFHESAIVADVFAEDQQSVTPQ